MDGDTLAIRVERLTKRFGHFTAVDNISFDVQRGEIFGFLGPNGAGKTTTIRILLGLLRPTAGEARVLGYDVLREANAAYQHVGYMSQSFTLYMDLSAEENVRFYGQAYGLGRKRLQERKAQVLAMAGLTGHERELTSHLSGGWKQRLALGCAIVHEPELLFLDEPTAGVDPVSRREFWELIYEMSGQGKTIFVTTHYMDEAERCQRLAIISGGRLVAMGSPDELKTKQMHGQILEITCDRPEIALRILSRERQHQHLAMDEVALYGAQIHVVAADPSAQTAIAALLAAEGIAVQAINWVIPSLEDAFISSVKEEKPETQPS